VDESDATIEVGERKTDRNRGRWVTKKLEAKAQKKSGVELTLPFPNPAQPGLGRGGKQGCLRSKKHDLGAHELKHQN